MTTIYLSSTYDDLTDHRRVVYEQLRKSGYEVIAMEDEVARDDRVLGVSLEGVRRTDIYIGIFSLRYGSVPPADHGNAEERSITELEFRQADSQEGTHCLTFVVDDEKTLPHKKWIDKLTGENESGKHIDRLRAYLRREKTPFYFNYGDTYELASAVQASVARHLKKHDAAGDPAPPPTITWSVADLGSPYPGLLHYTREFAPVYFGRESDTRKVLDLMQSPQGRFLIVSGASGTGKSSLVDAGVLPQLENTGLLHAGRCATARMVPSHGAQPFDALVRALEGAAGRAGFNPGRLGQALAENPDTLEDTLRTIAAQGYRRPTLVIFLDQMEELFVDDPETMELTASFLSSLHAAAERDAVRVVATIRSDLLHHCYGHERMRAVLNSVGGHYALGPITSYGLRDLIERPAACAGVTVPAQLTDSLIRDAGDEPGNLPLLAFAMRRLFERRQGDVLNAAVYDQWGGEALGGLRGAIAEHASEVEQALLADSALELTAETLPARLAEIFPSLVRVDLESLPTRRRAPLLAFAPRSRRLLEQLIAARLLTTDGAGEDAAVSVAHERLFEAWPALERWVVAHQDELRTLRQAELDAAEWRRHHYDLAHVWHAERLVRLQSILADLAAERGRGTLHEFAHPQQRLVELLKRPALTHQQRGVVGRYLTELGDPRPGTGVEPDGTPQIDWVPIDGGRVVLEHNGGEETVADFRIARHPVTNGQFQAFIDAEDGYRNPQWWQDMPEDANNGPDPSSWQEPGCPRETVSWYEAVAFCRWLSGRIGYDVTLPTEFQWQQAATGGQQDRVYPWGPDWDPQRCNSTESRLNRTTIVGLYPNGKSPDGVLDMAGNVWEWCLNQYDNPAQTAIDRSTDSRALRGGSWGDGRDYVRAAFRFGLDPGGRNGNLGCRVVCRPLSSNDH